MYALPLPTKKLPRQTYDSNTNSITSMP